MKKIGFANKYYTLWDVYEKVVSQGINYKVVAYECNYIKNISIDLDVVLTKYPNIEICDELKGRSLSFVTQPKRVYTDVETFRFGKYAEKRIDEINDANYIVWYVGEQYDEAHISYVESILLNKYGYVKHDDMLLTKSEYENMLKQQQEREDFQTMLRNHDTIEHTTEYNLYEYRDDSKTCGALNINGVTFVFREVVEYWYNGLPYYLPALNGKGKRIKNKAMLITDYTLVDEIVYVNKWSLKK